MGSFRGITNPHVVSEREVRAFQLRVWDFYTKQGRDLPWRNTNDPYRILVSEIMLQQTQVDRVIPKYAAFIHAFPDFAALAEACLGDVLAVWSGLGYNRRAKFLKHTAEVVISEYGGRLPRTRKELESLPGIGSYTAAAILAFAYNAPETLIETNIRTVFIHSFFGRRRTSVHDTDIIPYINATLDTDRPREWYWALMDYGSHLKRTHGNASRKSKHHTKQSAFSGSARQLRGAIIRELTHASAGLTPRTLAQRAGRTLTETHAQLDALHTEGFLKKEKQRYTLA